MPSGKQAYVMAELAGPLRVMKIAIQTAKIAYPDYERESGTKWPDKHLDPAEERQRLRADPELGRDRGRVPSAGHDRAGPCRSDPGRRQGRPHLVGARQGAEPCRRLQSGGPPD